MTQADVRKAPLDMNKQLAIKLGYHIYHYDKGVEASCYYSLQDPDGNPVISVFKDGERKTEGEAWADCPYFSENIPLLLEIIGNRVFTITHGPVTSAAGSDIEYTVVIDPAGYDLKMPRPLSQRENLGEAIVHALLQIDFEVEKRAKEKERIAKQIRHLQEQLEALEVIE